MGAKKDAKHLAERAKNYRHMWRNETGFMEARRADGSWAGDWAGWTEGDHWAYSLTVMVRCYDWRSTANGSTTSRG